MCSRQQTQPKLRCLVFLRGKTLKRNFKTDSLFPPGNPVFTILYQFEGIEGFRRKNAFLHDTAFAPRCCKKIK